MTQAGDDTYTVSHDDHALFQRFYRANDETTQALKSIRERYWEARKLEADTHAQYSKAVRALVDIVEALGINPVRDRGAAATQGAMTCLEDCAPEIVRAIAELRESAGAGDVARDELSKARSEIQRLMNGTAADQELRRNRAAEIGILRSGLSQIMNALSDDPGLVLPLYTENGDMLKTDVKAIVEAVKRTRARADANHVPGLVLTGEGGELGPEWCMSTRGLGTHAEAYLFNAQTLWEIHTRHDRFWLFPRGLEHPHGYGPFDSIAAATRRHAEAHRASVEETTAGGSAAITDDGSYPKITTQTLLPEWEHRFDHWKRADGWKVQTVGLLGHGVNDPGYLTIHEGGAAIGIFHSLKEAIDAAPPVRVPRDGYVNVFGVMWRLDVSMAPILSYVRGDGWQVLWDDKHKRWFVHRPNGARAPLQYQTMQEAVKQLPPLGVR